MGIECDSHEGKLIIKWGGTLTTPNKVFYIIFVKFALIMATLVVIMLFTHRHLSEHS